MLLFCINMSRKRHGHFIMDANLDRTISLQASTTISTNSFASYTKLHLRDSRGECFVFIRFYKQWRYHDDNKTRKYCLNALNIKYFLGFDSCASLAAECGITAAESYQYNPQVNLCSTLTPRQYICCSPGSLPNYASQLNSDGSCASYSIQKEENCSQLADTYEPLTVDEIDSYNGNTWGWLGCDHLQAEKTICLSSGTPPFPAPVCCGPQVASTQESTNGVSWELLNPCPLNACCDVWGQCGITDEFCIPSSPPTGAPATAASGQNGCISNCGSSIVNNAVGPSRVYKIGYFEAFNTQRLCLNMSADQIPSGYTHIHFAFANVSQTY